MKNSQFPTARKSGLVVQEVPDEVLVFDLASNKAHCLNQTAAMVWKSCDGNTDVPEIAKIIQKETGKAVNEDLVWLAIDQLNDSSLLEEKIVNPVAGQTRREVIKKIGLASMIAIPMVASLVAPQNALANVSCICMFSFDCSLPGFSCPSSDCCNMSLVCAPDPLGPAGCQP